MAAAKLIGAVDWLLLPPMPLVALVMLVSWLTLVAGVRGYVHYRRTGQVAAPVRVRPGEPQWWARVISSIGMLFAIAAPVAELIGLNAIGWLDHDPIRYAGVALAVVGIAATLAAQLAMSDSWRPDVDPDARGRLVTTGPFQWVRNPVLTCTAVTALGLALIVPNLFAALMLAAFIVAWEIQVRLVEEPYLARVHGDEYLRYAARTGRFLPRIGRLPGVHRRNT